MKKSIVIGIFLGSIVLLGYALFQIIWSEYSMNRMVEEWNQQVTIGQDSNQDEIKVENLIEKYRMEPGKANLKVLKRPNTGEIIGKMEIDRLDRTLPILQGSDSATLAKGVGHLPESVLPGEVGNSILAGHRDTVLRGLGELKMGDFLTIDTKEGSFLYEIIEHKIVDPDYQGLQLTHDKQMLTIITCYPFDFIGPAPQRYILTAQLK
ncbi:class D sortase [Ammoniphilus resinae]|uniref:Sortase A n=1 Tax=Ammoniphilus resinae TaxID=861532 RepID=A0ABS4GV30_9BACL|nr:class D sortase [Ammoniphilus resinae]MBP1934118.1 sortase A [Ammoniphilus resinae]